MSDKKRESLNSSLTSAQFSNRTPSKAREWERTDTTRETGKEHGTCLSSCYVASFYRFQINASSPNQIHQSKKKAPHEHTYRTHNHIQEDGTAFPFLQDRQNLEKKSPEKKKNIMIL